MSPAADAAEAAEVPRDALQLVPRTGVLEFITISRQHTMPGQKDLQGSLSNGG